MTYQQQQPNSVTPNSQPSNGDVLLTAEQRNRNNGQQFWTQPQPPVAQPPMTEAAVFNTATGRYELQSSVPQQMPPTAPQQQQVQFPQHQQFIAQQQPQFQASPPVTQPQFTAPQQQPPVVEPPATPQQTTEVAQEVQDQQLNELLQSKFGVTLEQFQTQYDSYQEAQVQQQKQGLSQTWGVSVEDVNRRLDLINQYAKANNIDITPYDNAMGVQFLWQQISQQVQTPQLDQPTNTVVSSNTAGQNSYMFTQSQLLSMSESEYQQRNPEIMYAYSNGLVLSDV